MNSTIDFTFEVYIRANIEVEDYLDSLPSDTKKIDVSRRGITSLPSLDHFTQLEVLECCKNNLTRLPPLPNSVELISCGDNKLKTLPVLPASLLLLFCYNNKLTVIPPLPKNLRALDCQQNKLIVLPDYRNLKNLCTWLVPKLEN